jgi:aminobenzoyl-glutamate utilization protein B
MSGTRHEIDFLTGCSDLLNNRALGELLMDNMKAIGGIKFDEADYEFARKLRATITDEMKLHGHAMNRKVSAKHVTDEMLGEDLCSAVIDPSDEHVVFGGSTEVGDVSQITPTGNLSTACVPQGTPGHSWQWTAASGSAIGLKGMMFAAKTMAGTALDLFEKPNLLKQARAQFELAKGGKKYKTMLPADAKPK